MLAHRNRIARASALRLCFQHWIARLQRKAACDIEHRLAGCGLDRAPEIVRDRIAVEARAQIVMHAPAEIFLADIAFQHADDSEPFFV